ncbi:MAG: MFS transporter [Rhizobiales bacterium]|nr:MFS transporter [Hyphomicrobiales bacterium]
MKARSIALLLVAEVAALSLWFVSAAILPEMTREVALSPFRQAALSSSVQAGFVLGALASAVFGLADRFDPRRVFAASALSAGLVNAVLLIAEPGSAATIAARFITGALMAGIYPVGMKIAVGWGRKDRGFLVGMLVAALTLGSAAPHLFALLGGTDWRLTVAGASLAAGVGGILCLFTGLGPFHGTAPKFDPKVITKAWTDRRIRLAYAGYLGHMWELYAMWAWIAVASAASYSATMAPGEADWLSKVTAFAAISAGGIACALAGLVADKIGKADIAIAAMVVSGLAALATAATFGGPAWLTFVVIFIWGAGVVPDSAQFSALVADASPPEQAGSLMTFQTALGFALTFATVQLTPVLADAFGWPIVLALMALGPAFGIVAMVRLRSLRRA